MISSVCVICASASLLAEGRTGTEEGAVVRTPLRSSTVVSAGFVQKSKILEIEFHSGAVYRYRNVPERVYVAFIAAQSKGRYFGTHIRGKYPFEKVNLAKQ